MYVNLKCIFGIIYLNCIIKMINIHKEILILEIERGMEVLIPKMIRQNDLPISFRYYDPVIKIIHSSMSTEKRGYFFDKM